MGLVSNAHPLHRCVRNLQVQSIEEFEQDRHSLDEATDAAEREALSLEKKQRYLGCLGISDPAEKRVGPAIRQLGRNIRIWVITGDQAPTAFYAAIDASICERDAPLVHLWDESVACVHDDIEEQLDRMLSPTDNLGTTWRLRRTNNVLAVGPRALMTLTTASEQVQRKLMQLCRKAETVIFYRMSPVQKANIIQMKDRCICQEPNSPHLSNLSNSPRRPHTTTSHPYEGPCTHSGI